MREEADRLRAPHQYRGIIIGALASRSLLNDPNTSANLSISEPLVCSSEP